MKEVVKRLAFGSRLKMMQNECIHGARRRLESWVAQF